VRNKALEALVVEALEDLKASDITVLPVAEMTSMTDCLMVVSGSSSRHVKALADNVVQMAKQRGFQPIGVEGTDSAEWVLVDFADVIVHIMLPATRQFYDLESLWTVRPA